jgi:hypothetical protein
MSDTTGTGLPSIEDAKEMMHDQITAVMEAYTYNYFVFNGHRWDSDATARSNLLGALEHAEHSGGLPPGFVWRDYDNNYVAMTVADLGDLAGAMFDFINLCYAISWGHKDAVDALVDIQSVLSYDFTSNWNTLPI